MEPLRGQASGVLEVPAGFKPSSLIGEPMRTRDGASENHFTVSRAYTLPRSIRRGRKRVKFVAEPA